MLPNVLFVGPTRSGTSWIDSYLRTCPDVALPQGVKETHFFDKRYGRGIRWYESRFGAADGVRACVEVAPSLLHKPEASARVARDLSNALVVCTLRNPVDRAVSHYYHYLKSGAPDVGFERMCRRYPDLIESGLYHKHLLRWEQAMGPGRLKLLSYDALRSTPEAFCAALCEMLDIDFVQPSATLLAGNQNEATVPRHRLAAKLVWKGAEILRWAGADGIINRVRQTGLRRVYGDVPQRSHRDAIFAQAMAYHDVLTRELPQLEDHFGLDLMSWKQDKEPSRAMR